MLQKFGKYRLFWIKSATGGIQRQQIKVAVNGVMVTGADIGPEVEEVQIEIRANSDVTYSVTAVSPDGRKAESVEYTFRVGDLEEPQPPTGLGHELLLVIEREVPTEMEPATPRKK